ncbi:unnamed protein product [Callosobruchus maculatus]|uniref:MADF domain-containing protein n=1 Tax=Callosobruchus maculatus TaxID=64391 RepID=A0A653BEU9_CALMS|nr:unnamed protein product [Callosobruchus maculatus]
MEETYTEYEEIPEATGQHELDRGLLIEYIQGYPHLYDVKDQLYKNVNKKAEAWEIIAGVLDSTVEDCMKAWKSLRDRYVKEKNRCASGSEAPESSWKYFDAMRFYAKFTKPRKTHTKPMKSTQSGRSSDSSTATKPLKSTQSDPSSDSSRPSSTMSMWSPIDEVCEVTITNTPRSEEGPGPSRRKRQQSLDTPISSGKSAKRSENSFLEVAKEIMKKIDEKQQMNPNKAFCEYLFTELEKLPEAEAKEKRKKILMIVFSD